MLKCLQFREISFYISFVCYKGSNPPPYLKVSCFFFLLLQRLVDKKMATLTGSRTSSSSKEMCDVVFCQLPSGEMKGLLMLF